MRSLILAAYVMALIAYADWSPATGLLLAALVAVWAAPLVRHRLIPAPVPAHK
ncbi:hypothetical protein [Actinoplanes sp. N902-109]|uniref:hypothetical protein n=1 Tax=Actinoplanes sp. (strain N902-109) TaxID=649831 RepID=UPI0003295330|nr:hypothetical protein [Actinoplanes sp. N902-109]AGL15936.1 hypothetical protein L083_2426 [Actinoplanes sp. N902-109]